MTLIIADGLCTLFLNRAHPERYLDRASAIFSSDVPMLVFCAATLMMRGLRCGFDAVPFVDAQAIFLPCFAKIESASFPACCHLH